MSLTKYNVNIIGAFCTNRGIGNNNTIHVLADLQRFKELTIGLNKQMNIVGMGQKTYDSLPKNIRPLSSRINIVLTSKSKELNDELF